MFRFWNVNICVDWNANKVYSITIWMISTKRAKIYSSDIVYKLSKQLLVSSFSTPIISQWCYESSKEQLNYNYYWKRNVRLFAIKSCNRLKTLFFIIWQTNPRQWMPNRPNSWANHPTIIGSWRALEEPSSTVMRSRLKLSTERIHWKSLGFKCR